MHGDSCSHLDCLCCPQYNSYNKHYREVDCMREMLEPFM